jgi:hypothetical protein
MNKPNPSPQEAADQMAQDFFGAGTDKASQQRTISQYILAAVECGVLVPALFYFRFGEVGGLGWGLTVFFIAYCLLAAIGLYFRPRTEYHTTVKVRGDWVDHIGSFWLISCAFGPFLGWALTSVLPITITSWRWVYGLQIALAVGLPVLTALPMTRYLRGKATLIALPILVVVTSLPAWSVVNVSRDLWAGPVVRQVQTSEHNELYLQYTDRSLDMIK